jgi:hypothetical protein
MGGGLFAMGGQEKLHVAALLCIVSTIDKMSRFSNMAPYL